MNPVRTETIDGVTVITLSNPPVNAMSHPVRIALVDAIDAASADPQVQAIVLSGDGASFSAGAEIREFGTPMMIAEPSLPSMISLIEDCDKPVIAALHGTCLGGGLELPLGCHYRIAALDAKFGLPEVKLGLLPGAGGTQRLPRCAGLELATNLIVSGETAPAPALAMAGAIDQLVPPDQLRSQAIDFARKVASIRPLPLVRDRSVNHPDADAYLSVMRLSLRNAAAAFPAPHKCIDALRAAVDKPFAEGLEIERQLFTHLMFTPESQALRHFFFAERAAGKVAGVPDGSAARTIERVGVVGAGTMGQGIALSLLAAGIPVRLLDVDPAGLERGLAAVRADIDKRRAKGKLKPERAVQQSELIVGALTYDALSDCDLVIEAVFEDMTVKLSVFKALDAVLRPGAILASNTSTLDIDVLAAFTNRPQDVVGLHFFSPANVMKLLEVVRGRATSAGVLMTAMALAKRIRKTAVVAGVCDGFIGNRMIDAYGRAAGFAMEEGASPQQIDTALERFGMAMGPFRMSDLAGNDISWSVRKRKLAENPGYRYATVADTLCLQGRFGQKAGRGWYRYAADGRTALPDAEVDAMISAHRVAIGLTPRAISDDEIVTRCVLALVNEGARILEDGIASRASDIDLAYIYGYGFPVQRGGPMNYANRLGLYAVERRLRRLARDAHGCPTLFQPAALIKDLARAGREFT
jgi:3-hydroxyacyl-CoA dehydrogenase